MQWARNFLRSLPLRLFSSASFEHWIDSGVCTAGFLTSLSLASAAPLQKRIVRAAAAANLLVEIIVCSVSVVLALTPGRPPACSISARAASWGDGSPEL